METPDQCPNCGTPLQTGAGYCPACGQKKAPSRVPASEILGEFFSTVLAWDSRLWRTLKRSLAPGELTIAYFKGKRASLIPPARLFLFAVLLHLAVINYFLSPNLFQSDNDQRLGQEMVDLERSIQLARQSREQWTDSSRVAPGSLEALDTMIRQWEDKIASLESKRVLNFNVPLVSERQLSFSLLELETSHPDSLCKQHGITSMSGRLIIHQLIKAYRHPRNFGNFIVARLSWMIFLLVPLMALVLFLLYLRGPWYYIEHLIFIMHVHVAAFLLVSFGLVMDSWSPVPLSGWCLAGSLGYTFMAMKRFYGQGWMKTSLKFILYHIAYVWVGAATGVLLLVAGFLLFST